MNRLLLAGCGIALAGTAVAAEAAVLVVRSSGPSAKAFPAGRALPENQSIILRGNDVVILLDSRGTRTLRGPGTYSTSVSAGGSASAMSALGGHVRTGSRRGEQGRGEDPQRLLDDLGLRVGRRGDPDGSIRHDFGLPSGLRVATGGRLSQRGVHGRRGRVFLQQNGDPRTTPAHGCWPLRWRSCGPACCARSALDRANTRQPPAPAGDVSRGRSRKPRQLNGAGKSATLRTAVLQSRLMKALAKTPRSSR